MRRHTGALSISLPRSIRRYDSIGMPRSLEADRSLRPGSPPESTCHCWWSRNCMARKSPTRRRTTWSLPEASSRTLGPLGPWGLGWGLILIRVKFVGARHDDNQRTKLVKNVDRRSLRLQHLAQPAIGLGTLVQTSTP